MTCSKTVSVAMATYNGADYVREQLQSIIFQFDPPQEIIICDDNSTDETLLVMRDVLSLTHGIRVEIHENSLNIGYTKNFKKAVSLCTGDIILLADQDDVWLPHKISRIKDVVTSVNSLVVHDGLLVNEKLEWAGSTVFSQANKIYGNTKMVNTGALSAFGKNFQNYLINIPEGVIGHDIWLHSIADSLMTKIYINEPLQLVRRHSRNTSSWLANELQQLNWIDIIANKIRSSPALTYSPEILLHDGISTLFSGINALCKDERSSVNMEALSAYHVRVANAFRCREEVIAQKGLHKLIMALKLLISGKYKYMKGWKSFCRDLLR